MPQIASLRKTAWVNRSNWDDGVINYVRLNGVIALHAGMVYCIVHASIMKVLTLLCRCRCFVCAHPFNFC